MFLQIRMQADDFLRAHKVLTENFETSTLALMEPSIVCLAFSVELYLKDLHFRLTENAPHGHHIYELFKNLPEKTKQDIFAHKSISQNPFMTRGNIFSSQFYSPNYSKYERFIDQMKAISSGFKEWRYSYEAGTLNYDRSFALNLIEAITSVADEIRSQQ